MSKIWNRISSTLKEFGGGAPVWINPPKRKIVGALVLNPLQDMEKISAATPLAYDNSLHQAKFQKAWEVVSQTENEVVLKATKRSPEIYVGINVMKAPATITGTGGAVAVTAVVQNAANNTVTITAASLTLGTVVAGDFLVEAASAGAAVQMYAVPANGVYELSIDDTIGGDITFTGIAQGAKYLYDNTIPAIPPVIKAAIKDVEWEKFNEVN